MGWRYDPDKFRRHVDEARTFGRYARGKEPASWDDLLGRPFLPPEGEPVQYPVPSLPLPTGPGDDDRLDVALRLQQIAQLYESGLITYPEFQSLRERVLSAV